MGLIVAGPGAALAFSAASGGKTYPFNALDAVTPQLVAPENTGRQSITFHNPGAVDVFVYMASKTNMTTGAREANTPTVAAPGGSFRVFANGGSLELKGGENTLAWYALAASGTTGALTVMDSNV